jgi:hypothetical protein
MVKIPDTDHGHRGVRKKPTGIAAILQAGGASKGGAEGGR